MTSFSVRRSPREVTLEDVRTVCHSIGLGEQVASRDELDVSPIGGGLTNLLFKCSDAAGHKVLIRLYGDNTERIIDREREAEVVSSVVEHGFGAKVYGHFANGRVEQFLPGRPLESEEMSHPLVWPTLARLSAEMHALPVPGSKKTTLFQDILKWLGLALKLDVPSDPALAAIYEALPVSYMMEEALWLMNETEKPEHASEIVFSHGDLLSSNVMATVSDTDDRAPEKPRAGFDPFQDSAPSLRVIDFEYSNYNPRAFDIANHFNEYAGFDCLWDELYPSAGDQVRWLRTYLLHTDSPRMESDAIARRLLDEVAFYSLHSHLYWASWAMVQELYSQIDFGYLAYAQRRMERYQVEKQRYI